MNEEPKTTEIPPAAETIQVNDLQQFVNIMVAWHSRKVKVLEHMLQMPDGIEMQVGDDAVIVLEGVAMQAYKAGINFALMEMGKLPFAVEYEQESANDEPKTDAPA